MLRTALLLLLVGLLTPSVARAESKGWLFVGILVREKTGCVNDPSMHAGFVWIRRDKDRDEHRKKLKQTLREKYGTRVETRERNLSLGKPALIALVKKHLLCTRYSGPKKPQESYSFYFAKDRSDLDAQIAQDRKHHREIQGVDIVELIDASEQLPKLENQGQATMIGRSPE